MYFVKQNDTMYMHSGTIMSIISTTYKLKKCEPSHSYNYPFHNLVIIKIINMSNHNNITPDCMNCN